MLEMMSAFIHTFVASCVGVYDFSPWKHLKNKVYATNHHTLEELKAHFLKRCQKCVDEAGQHFQHLTLSSSSSPSSSVFCPRAGPSQ